MTATVPAPALRRAGAGAHGGRYRALALRDVEPRLERAGVDVVSARAVAAVLPFRVNSYVVEELVDWDAVPDDPIYQLVFPQPGMLDPRDLGAMRALVERGAARAEVERRAHDIRRRLNPHPGGQLELNVPSFRGRRLGGVQHKYRETVLVFPSRGQTCHAYCTYCFRWAQFVGERDLHMATNDVDTVCDYVAEHTEIRNVLMTGGDPMIMSARVLARWVEPLLASRFEHVDTVRIGTKAVAYWPQRFVSDDDADDVLRLFERVVRAGRELVVVAHFTHPRELDAPLAVRALERIRASGAVVYCQAPLVAHVNDSAAAWAELWRREARLGCVPYYMFVERDTGPSNYFEVPLVRAVDIFHDAYRRVPGVARTVRGPVMSTTGGKVAIDGVARVGDVDAFALRFTQARDPELVGRPFFAELDAGATWFDDLTPLGAHDARFFPAGAA